MTLLFTVGAAGSIRAQPTSAPPVDPLAQLMVTQPSIEVVTNPVATAAFDPPVIRVGGQSTFRVTFNALEDSIKWPEEIPAPPQLELRLSARGQLLLPAADKLKPFTAINHQVRAAEVGSFTIPPFVVDVYDRAVTVPAARLEVVPATAAAPPPAPRLAVEPAEVNAYAGQAVNVRVSASNLPQGLTQVRLNGDGFLVDHGTARQIMTLTPGNGRNVLTSVYETSLTPLAAGKLTFSAQGFTAGSRLGSGLLIQGQPAPPSAPQELLLLDSDPVTINVRPLPQTGALPGFTGAIGNFTRDPPQLSTNQARVGELVKLAVTFRGEGNLARLVPPPPPVTGDWQISEPVAGGAPPPSPPVVKAGQTSIVARTAAPAGPTVTFTYTLMPMTEKVTATPAIPFSYFDFREGVYVDLTIPPVPIKVAPGAAAVDSSLWAEAGTDATGEEEKLTLSALAMAPGRSAGSLVPLQQRGWFVAVQLLPVIGFAGLWGWDRRRKYLEQHPDFVLRKKARRALRREKRALEKAARAGDTLGYANTAVRAMRVACAPHYPAEPRALVCRDVLELLGERGHGGEVVRRFFAVADASRFSTAAMEAGGLLSLRPDLDRVLQELEARL